MQRFLAYASVVVASTILVACSRSTPPTAPSSPSITPSGFGAIVPATEHPSLAACVATPGTPGCVTAPPFAGRQVAGSAAIAPSATMNLVASSSGSSVTLTWSAPTGGDPVTTYIIEAGSAPGLANLANFATGNTLTTFQASGVGAGTYYVRIRAANAAGSGSPSNEAVLVVTGTGPCIPPGLPIGLTIAANSGGTVTLTWTAPTGPITSYVLDAGSGSGLSNLASSDLGTSATTLTATGVAAGTYYVRVRARNACGTSGTSNEVVVTVTGGFRAGTWSYLLNAGVPLAGGGGPMSCTANSSGTTTVNSNGMFSIPFSGLTCSGCTMSGTITGTIGSSSVSGSVTASTTGSGCSFQQPTPSPAAMSGSCSSINCTASTGANLNPNLSFAVSYTLTPQ